MEIKLDYKVDHKNFSHKITVGLDNGKNELKSSFSTNPNEIRQGNYSHLLSSIQNKINSLFDTLKIDKKPNEDTFISNVLLLCA